MGDAARMWLWLAVSDVCDVAARVARRAARAADRAYFAAIERASAATEWGAGEEGEPWDD